MADFSHNLIKQYKHWGVYVAENQNYLGRCVIWCDREDALDLADATPDEQKELFEILPELREAVRKAFKADWSNYAFLGNDTRHLHCHFVPRYESEREFADTTFKDERWRHSYRTDREFTTSDELRGKIKQAIKEKL